MKIDEKSVTAYLAGLVWDGTPRLDRWLVDYAGAEDSAYVRTVSRKMLVAAVRRARAPGSVFDQLPVIVGPQGSGKTSALRALACTDDWFTDNLPIGSDTRRFIEATAGKWIVEAAELNDMCREDSASFKWILSRTWDESRMPYAHKRERFAREFVIIGTSHETEGYLIDTPENRRWWPAPENRRFWPVCIQRFDLGRLRADRDQLWAEAAEAEAIGESILFWQTEVTTRVSPPSYDLEDRRS
jgi:predicted P-loop ATPase